MTPWNEDVSLRVMTAPLKSIEGTADVAALMREIGAHAKAAARVLALAPAEQKNAALAAMADAIRAGRNDILAANAEDIAEAKAAGANAAFLDRLALDPRRVAAMAAGVAVVRDLADPVGTVMERWTRPNGMTIERVRVPLGVVGIVYESRPNVTADAGVLCLKAGNAAILRGGSESHRSNRAILSRAGARGAARWGRGGAGRPGRAGGRCGGEAGERSRRGTRISRRHHRGRAGGGGRGRDRPCGALGPAPHRRVRHRRCGGG